MQALYMGLLALIAEGSGVAIGIILLYLFDIKSKRIIGMLFGATSGIMIAMICFDVLPEALHTNENTLVIIGVVIGILVGLLLQDITLYFEAKAKHLHSKMLGTAFVLFIGIALHNIPEGFALGSLAHTSNETIIKFAWVISLHSIPEAIAVAIPFKEAHIKKSTLCLIPFLLGSIMGIGAILGATLSQISGYFVVVALGSAAGIILYIVCEELLPESRKVWNGRMTTVATIIGIIIGMLLVK